MAIDSATGYPEMEAFHCIVKFTEEYALLSVSRKLDAVSILGMMILHPSVLSYTEV